MKFKPIGRVLTSIGLATGWIGLAVYVLFGEDPVCKYVGCGVVLGIILERWTSLNIKEWQKCRK